MRANDLGAIPADLAILARRFAAWRRVRPFGARIPDPLWAEAVLLARRHGLSRTAVTLGLGYYALKKRLGTAAASRSRPLELVARPTFVELPPPTAGSAECVIEFEKAGGARLRIHLQGGVPDLAALARGFWESP